MIIIPLKFSNKYTYYLLAFICLEVFLFVFFPSNRTEVDDGYWYAQGVRDEDYLNLFNPRFLLFLPLMKLVYDFIHFLNINVDAYYLMCSVSMLFSGLSIVLLYDTLAAHLDLGKKTSFLASLAVLISYEFWRYSYEAEVYIISIFFILVAFRWFMATKKEQGFLHVVLLAVLCAFTTLLYKPNFIPLFIVFPLIFLYFGKSSHLIFFYIIGALVIVGSFSIVHSYLPTEVSFIDYLFGGTNQPVGQAYMSIFVIASNIVSVLWIFSADGAVNFIRDKFPHKVIEEEIYLAQQINGIEIVMWLCLASLFILLSILIVRAIIIKLILTPYQEKAVGIVVIWLAIYGAFLIFMDPSSNEPWLMVQIPIIILVSVLLVKPLKNSQLWLVYFLLFLLFINNSIGGIWLLKDSSNDYNKCKVQWLVENTDDNDIILSYGPISFIRYLRYTTSATIIDIEESSDLAFEILKNRNLKNVYITEDVLDPPEAIQHRSKHIVETVNDIFNQNDLKAVPVSSTEFMTYELTNNNQ